METLADPKEFITAESGETPAGALEVGVKNIGNSPAIVNGIEIAAGEAWNYGFVGKVYRAIAYDANGSQLRIRYTI